MKHLLTLVIWVASSLAMAQFPSLPYNPDENGDGLIGVVDLQGLLANYGNEFASAVVSEDGESAIVYMGEMAYPFCAQACKHLPGKWELPNVEDLALVWDEVYTFDVYTYTWLRRSAFSGHQQPNAFISGPYEPDSQHYTARVDEIAGDWRCYCAAKQLPRVEYSYCYAQGYGGLDECSSSKMSEGWYPMGGVATSANSNNTISVHFVQAFWRWAE